MRKGTNSSKKKKNHIILTVLHSIFIIIPEIEAKANYKETQDGDVAVHGCNQHQAGVYRAPGALC